MSDWAAKRFWKTTTTKQTDTGFTVLLDDRSIKTPAKTALNLPTQALADAVAEEWDAQIEKVDPNTMPMTRSANAALDKVAHQRAAVADMLAEYGGTDLLCYRANSPAELVQMQATKWDPILGWAEQTFGVKMILGEGVMFVEQPAESLSILTERVHQFDPFELTGFHDLVAISGSLILGFAVTEGHLSAQEAWELSRVDEEWQIAQWGADDEAESMAKVKNIAYLDAYRFMKLAMPSTI